MNVLWCDCLKVTSEGFSSVVFSQGATEARTGQCCKRCIGQSALHQTVRSYCRPGQSVLPIWKFFHLHWCAGYCWFWWVNSQAVSNLYQVWGRGWGAPDPFSIAWFLPLPTLLEPSPSALSSPICLTPPSLFLPESHTPNVPHKLKCLRKPWGIYMYILFWLLLGWSS